MRRLSSTISLLPLWWALLPACSQTNTDHCGNREGHPTCYQQDKATPFCSICVATNNGCVDKRPDDGCFATTAPATSTAADSSSSTVDPTTGGSESNTSTTGSTSTGPTTDPTTGTTTTTGQTDTSTTTPGTTTTGDTSTTSTDTSTSTGDTVDTVDTLGTSTSTTGDTDTTAGTTMEPDPCGNNMIDEGEVCDGTNNNKETCKSVYPDKWGGGMLACNEGCQSFNDAKCCIGLGQKCGGLNPDGACCPGLTCKVDMLLGTVCKN
ncbi:MAG TPA: hypothetical protein VGB85_11865 [Nannocystis sp.]|jgi:hypothetical protein